MEKILKPTDVFATDFSTEVSTLIPHDLIAEKQKAYLNMQKDNLKQGEYVVISDFSENYTFVIQVTYIFIANLPFFHPYLRKFDLFLFCSRTLFNRTTGLVNSAQFILLRSTTKTQITRLRNKVL